jgi:hypothetical protein
LFIFSVHDNLKTLAEVDVDRLWTHGNITIRTRNSEGDFSSEQSDYEQENWISGYLGKNITPNAPDSYDVFFYNKRMLRKYCQRQLQLILPLNFGELGPVNQFV